MATPQSTTSHDGGDSKKNLEQITFRFCSECSNMLYPKEDEDTHKLQFTCRTCQYTEEANSTCVFRHVLNNAAGETAGVTQDVGSDPTVGNPSTTAQPLVNGACPVIICLCCGKVMMCDVCGKEPAHRFPGSPGYSVRVELVESNDDIRTDMDFFQLSDEYDFENDMEYGNGSETEE